MALTIQTKSTSRFLEPTPYLCLLATVLVIIAAFLSIMFSQPILSNNVQVEADEPVELKTVEVKSDGLGALRIDVKASIPTNRWLTYELQLVDEQGNLVASALKEAWKESGTWYEDGESGTWQEEDLMGGLDVRPTQKESQKLTISLAVLDYTDTSGREIDQPVNFKVNINNGVIDSRYLWLGFFGTSILTGLSFLAVGNSGQTAIRKWICDSDVGERGIVGGADNLVEVTVDVKADETCPSELDINLWVYDGYGEEIYTCILPMTVKYIRDNGTIDSAKGKVQKYLILEKRGSYRFYVEVMPDQPVDRTEIIVREKVSTNFPVGFVTISDSVT
jgi:hypothetical protein